MADVTIPPEELNRKTSVNFGRSTFKSGSKADSARSSTADGTILKITDGGIGEKEFLTLLRRMLHLFRCASHQAEYHEPA